MSVSAGERRIVSVLVADVAGSTEIGEKLGPERSKFLFDEIVRLMREEVERFGGTVAQLTGDGLLALFGVPVAHEDDAERAARAALAIHEALTRFGDEVGPAYGIELAARVAVNTGPVVVPAGDEPPDQLYNALGDTVNVEVEGWIAAEKLAEQLRKIGVRIKPVEANIVDFIDFVSGDVDAFVWGWEADFPDPAGMIAPFLEHHPFLYRDAEIQELLEHARVAPDQNERLAMYREVERQWIGEHVAIVPVGYGRRVTVLRPWVEGYWQNALVTSTFAEVVVRRPDSAPRPA